MPEILHVYPSGDFAPTCVTAFDQIHFFVCFATLAFGQLVLIRANLCIFLVENSLQFVICIFSGFNRIVQNTTVSIVA